MFSSPQTLASGVPQGSISGPILFLIYINDLSLFIKNSNLDFYVDDSTLYTSGTKSLEVQTNFQSSLNSILDWCTYNNMLVNPTKTKCMLIGPKNKSTSCKLDLRINNVPIENVESHKILGVHVDKHLSWAVHIDKTCLKINSKIALLKRISIYLTFEMKQLFYSSYVLPYLDYCCPVWGRNTKRNLARISMPQKKAARIILGASMRTPSKDLFTQLRWLSFGNRCNYHTALLIYKSLNNLTEKYIKDIISFSKNSSYNLRSATRHDITNSRYKTSFKKNAFSYASMEVWNKIPTFGKPKQYILLRNSLRIIYLTNKINDFKSLIQFLLTINQCVCT